LIRINGIAAALRVTPHPAYQYFFHLILSFHLI